MKIVITLAITLRYSTLLFYETMMQKMLLLITSVSKNKELILWDEI